MDDISKLENTNTPDLWHSLKKYTDARIALGRTGVSIPLQESLNFRKAHAHARDAVYASLKKEELMKTLEYLGYQVTSLHSMATSRQEYLQRPDLGRKLNEESVSKLNSLGQTAGSDVVFILADGLSSIAVNKHAIPLLQYITSTLQSRLVNVGPVLLVEQARVAISDEIGFLLKASLAVILIGERPGLSSPDSLGIYLTYNPLPGLTDHARNCVSNVRPEGLPYQEAADKITWLIIESLRRKISGVALKEFYNDTNSLPATTENKGLFL